MNKIGLISCALLKQKNACMAQDMYLSALFKGSQRFVNKHYDNYYILSAKYGLVDKNQKIKPYNLTLNTLTQSQKNQWAVLVAQQIKKIIPKEDELFILAGANYYKDLLKYIQNRTNIIMEGLPIGKRLQYLNNNL